MGLGPPLAAAGAAGTQRRPAFDVRQSGAGHASNRPRQRTSCCPTTTSLRCFRSAATRPRPASIRREVIPGHDVLGLFAPGGEPAPGDPPAQTRDDDILGLFNAGDSQAGQLGAEAAPAKDDPLGLFEVAPETPPFGEAPVAPVAPQSPEGGPAEPDILDLFGVPPAKPEGKEAK
jgi:hypothetical protein